MPQSRISKLVLTQHEEYSMIRPRVAVPVGQPRAVLEPYNGSERDGMVVHLNPPKELIHLVGYLEVFKEVVPIPRDVHVFLHSGVGFMGKGGGAWNKWWWEKVRSVDEVTPELLEQWRNEIGLHFGF